MLAGQIVVKLPYSAAPVCRTSGVRECPREDDERLLRRPEPRRHVVRIEVRGLDALVLAPVPSGFFSLPLCHSTFPFARPALHLPQNISISAFQHVACSRRLVSTSAHVCLKALADRLTRRRSRRADKRSRSRSALKCCSHACRPWIFALPQDIFYLSCGG